MPQSEHKPIRTCLGCRQKNYQDQLIRLNLDKKGRLVIVYPNTTSVGRSVYVCYSKSCIEKFVNAKNIVFKNSKYSRITAKLSDYERAKLKFKLFRVLAKAKESNW